MQEGGDDVGFRCGKSFNLGTSVFDTSRKLLKSESFSSPKFTLTRRWSMWPRTTRVELIHRLFRPKCRFQHRPQNVREKNGEASDQNRHHDERRHAGIHSFFFTLRSSLEFFIPFFPSSPSTLLNPQKKSRHQVGDP